MIMTLTRTSMWPGVQRRWPSRPARSSVRCRNGVADARLRKAVGGGLYALLRKRSERALST